MHIGISYEPAFDINSDNMNQLLIFALMNLCFVPFDEIANIWVMHIGIS